MLHALPKDLPKVGLGIDYLGIRSPKFDCSTAKKYFPQKTALGVLFDTTFGTETECIRDLADSPDVTAIRAHLLNGACLRNNRCQVSDLLSGYTVKSLDSEIKTGTGQIYKIIDSQMEDLLEILGNPTRKPLYVSPILEHNLSEDGAIAVLSYLNAKYPNLQFVNNPVFRQNIGATKALLELHGYNNSGKADIVSTDGNSASKDRFIQLHSLQIEHNRKFSFLWTSKMNGNLNDKAEFIPPLSRTDWPSEEDFKQIKSMLELRH